MRLTGRNSKCRVGMERTWKAEPLHTIPKGNNSIQTPQASRQIDLHYHCKQDLQFCNEDAIIPA